MPPVGFFLLVLLMTQSITGLQVLTFCHFFTHSCSARNFTSCTLIDCKTPYLSSTHIVNRQFLTTSTAPCLSNTELSQYFRRHWRRFYPPASRTVCNSRQFSPIFDALVSTQIFAGSTCSLAESNLFGVEVGKCLRYIRPNLKSGTRTPPREYYACWSQEIMSVYHLDHNKDICGQVSLVLLKH